MKEGNSVSLSSSYICKKDFRKALTFTGYDAKISKCDAFYVSAVMRESHKNKQSIHSHPAASLAGVQNFDLLDSVVM